MDFNASMLQMMNKERQKPVAFSNMLSRKAQIRADEACKNFSHDGYLKQFEDSQAGYVGENLAKDFDTPEDTHKALMNSPKHKENIVKPEYKFVGMARGKSCNSFAQLFADSNKLNK
jgi:uncharacterized protein YkwD